MMDRILSEEIYDVLPTASDNETIMLEIENDVFKACQLSLDDD